MATRTAKLLSEIEAAHEFSGEYVEQWEACGILHIDQCPICGLIRRQFRNGQNSPDADTFERAGEDVCLADAVTCR